jgi:hypothetical protein
MAALVDGHAHATLTCQSSHRRHGTERLYQGRFKDDPTDVQKFGYPADHPLTAEFEEQMVAFVREYTGEGE